MKPFYDTILFQYACSFLNTPYRWGGDDPTGFDCSGVVLEILKSCGLVDPNVDKTAQGIYDHFRVDRAYETGVCSFGALVFYGHSLKRITHVAFGFDQYRVLEAGGGGASVLSLEDAVKKNAFVRIRPYKYRSDVVGILKPNYGAIGYL